MQLDDGWALEELPAAFIDAPPIAETEACIEDELNDGWKLDDGWTLQDVPRATVIRTPERVVIYPRSVFTPAQARKSMRRASWRRAMIRATS